MSVLLDTGVLLAFLNEDDERHGEAKDLMLRVVNGDLGSPAVSDGVAGELLDAVRARGLGAAVEEAARRLLPLPDSAVPGMRLVTLPPSALDAAWRTFERHRDRRISFADAALLVLLSAYGLEALATFDPALRDLAPATATLAPPRPA